MVIQRTEGRRTNNGNNVQGSSSASLLLVQAAQTAQLSKATRTDCLPCIPALRVSFLISFHQRTTRMLFASYRPHSLLTPRFFLLPLLLPPFISVTSPSNCIIFLRMPLVVETSTSSLGSQTVWPSRFIRGRHLRLGFFPSTPPILVPLSTEAFVGSFPSTDSAWFGILPPMKTGRTAILSWCVRCHPCGLACAGKVSTKRREPRARASTTWHLVVSIVRRSA